MRSRLFAVSCLAAAALAPVPAVAQAPIVAVAAKMPFAELEKRLAAAIAANKMNIVTRASASDGARGRGVAIPGDVVLGVFRNDFAVRMLASDVEAGIEAPIRLHLVEEPDGSASIRWRRPAAVFAPYQGEDLAKVGRELDAIFDKILADALAP